jgi:hypothetical protein
MLDSLPGSSCLRVTNGLSIRIEVRDQESVYVPEFLRVGEDTL